MAVISYKILEFLENRSYMGCYHERDFIPGELIADNIMDKFHSHSYRYYMTLTSYRHKAILVI